MKRLLMLVGLGIVGLALLWRVLLSVQSTQAPIYAQRPTFTTTPVYDYLPVLVKDSNIPTVTPTPLTLAIIGDYGLDGPDEAAVATQVATWNPAALLTTGDNNYASGAATTIDANIGKYYHAFIAPYQGSYGSGAITNSFFPALGNHDWVTPNAAPYLAYFALPGNERYYSVRFDSLEVFVLDSDPNEPDGITAASVQAQWLQNALGQSTACWKLVTLHHAPYSSAQHGSTAALQWPYATWGVDAVLAGHDHVYERLEVNGLPYIVNGLGGNPSIYSFPTVLPESLVRYNAQHGAQRLQLTPNQLRLDFFNTSNVLIDSLVLNKSCP